MNLSDAVRRQSLLKRPVETRQQLGRDFRDRVRAESGEDVKPNAAFVSRKRRESHATTCHPAFEKCRNGKLSSSN